MINFLTLSFRAKKIVRWRTIITVEECAFTNNQRPKTDDIYV